MGSGTLWRIVRSLSPHLSSKPVYWYDTASAQCWKSTGTTASDWEVDVNGFIADYTANQNDRIIVDHIRFDEGNGALNEDVQTLSVQVESSDTQVVPLATIKLYYAGALLGTAAGGPYLIGDPTTEDDSDFKLEIRPPGATAGTSIIKVSVSDAGGVPVRDVYQTFSVTVREGLPMDVPMLKRLDLRLIATMFQ